ncbi:phosphate ABC transporter permease subunit PstC [bacterium]|nr:phosphate ABC transporter permease subunit PstC [bacterium]
MLPSELKDRIMKYGLIGAASTSLLIVGLIFIFLFKEAAPFVLDPGIGAFFDLRWEPVSYIAERWGLLPLITGSLLVTLLATLFAIPFGVLGAIYIAEIATPVEREIVKPFIEMLAGIPSVVIGFFGLVVLSPLIKHLFDLSSGLNALTGALLLALMSIPTIITISEDAIKSVPKAYKEASMAMGANKIQTIFRVVVPAAMSGIIAAIMLGMGRVIGETMAVLMVTGNAPLITVNPFESVRTMTACIAAEMGEVAFGDTHYMALFWVGIVLLFMTFFINFISMKVLKGYQR